jgi:hypothetical protein
MGLSRGVSIALVLSGLTLVGCASHKSTAPERVATNANGDVVAISGGGGGGFLGIGGGNKKKIAAQAAKDAAAGIGVNSYLWRASLDTLHFMPLASADPWGGVIITDWFSSAEKPDERFKATVYILDTRLRADALNVTVFKQVKDASGGWVDSAVADQTATDIENSILTKARQLRLANIQADH